MDHKPLDGSLQVTSAVPVVSSFGQQEFSCRGRGCDGEPLGCAFLDPLLYRLKLQVNDPTQLLVSETTEHHHLVNAVHKLRRKLTPGGICRGSINLLVEVARQ